MAQIYHTNEISFLTARLPIHSTFCASLLCWIEMYDAKTKKNIC